MKCHLSWVAVSLRQLSSSFVIPMSKNNELRVAADKILREAWRPLQNRLPNQEARLPYTEGTSKLDSY